MVTKFECKCGNNDPSKVYEHDGMLGYSALVCRNCGTYYDHTGEHPADDFSKQFIVTTLSLRDIMLRRIEEIRKLNANFRSDVTRWRNVTHGNGKTHISMVKFEELNDCELLFLFEKIIQRMSKQM
jgi:hypothetical protein